MKRKIITAILALTMIFTMNFTMTACSDDKSQMEKLIAAIVEWIRQSIIANHTGTLNVQCSGSSGTTYYFELRSGSLPQDLLLRSSTFTCTGPSLQNSYALGPDTYYYFLYNGQATGTLITIKTGQIQTISVP